MSSPPPGRRGRQLQTRGLYIEPANSFRILHPAAVSSARVPGNHGIPLPTSRDQDVYALPQRPRSLSLTIRFLLLSLRPLRLCGEHSYSQPSNPDDASATARKMARALFSVSTRSFTGIESATIPAPAWI